MEAPFCFFSKGMFTGCHVNPHVTGRIDLCCKEFHVAEPKVQEASSNFPKGQREILDVTGSTMQTWWMDCSKANLRAQTTTPQAHLLQEAQ